MPSKKLLIILTCGLPVLGVLGTGALIASSIRAFAEFLRQPNASADEISRQVDIITRQLGTAYWSTAVGMLGGTVGLTLLVLRSRQPSPPIEPMEGIR